MGRLRRSSSSNSSSSTSNSAGSQARTELATLTVGRDPRDERHKKNAAGGNVAGSAPIQPVQLSSCPRVHRQRPCPVSPDDDRPLHSFGHQNRNQHAACNTQPQSGAAHDAAVEAAVASCRAASMGMGEGRMHGEQAGECDARGWGAQTRHSPLQLASLRQPAPYSHAARTHPRE